MWKLRAGQDTLLKEENDMSNFFTRGFNNRDALIISLVLSFAYVYPVINAGVYYIDDLARSQTGYLGWTPLGRPLSDFIFFILSFGGSTSVDVSPLPQILSFIVMGFTIRHISKNLFGEQTISSVICSSLIFLTPFFLHNVIYKYDSLSMVLSLSACVYAVYFRSQDKKIEVAVKSALLICSLCLYQVSAVAFIMLLSLNYLSEICKRNEISAKVLIIDALSLFSAYAIYFSILNLFINTKRSETIFSQNTWADLLLLNIKKFISMYTSGFGNFESSIILIGSLLAISIYIIILINKWKYLNNILTKFIACAFLVLPAALILASMLTIVILKESLILPRIATSFGFVLLWCSLLIYIRFKTLAGVFGVLLASSAIISSFALSSAAADQYSKDKMLISEIKQSITNNSELSRSKTTTFGIANESMVAKINSISFPIVKMINSRVYDGTASIMLTRSGLEGVNFSFARKMWMEKAISVCKKQIPVVRNNEFSIYNKDYQNYVFLGAPPRECLVK